MAPLLSTSPCADRQEIWSWRNQCVPILTLTDSVHSLFSVATSPPPPFFYFAKNCFHFEDINSSSHSKTFSPPFATRLLSSWVSFLWYIGLSNFYMIQSIYLSPVACLFNKSLQYPDQRKLIPVSFPPDSFRFYFFHLTLSSIWKLFWFRAWSRALTYFFFLWRPLSLTPTGVDFI